MVMNNKEKKNQTTIYLTEEAEDKLYDLQNKYRKQENKKDRSQIVCEAIDLLYRHLKC